jgi:hypothetical protein
MHDAPLRVETHLLAGEWDAKTEFPFFMTGTDRASPASIQGVEVHMARNRLLQLCLLVFLFSPSAGFAITLGVDFAADYTFADLGSVPGLPTPYGGLTLLPGDPNTLLIGGSANEPFGNLHTIGVTRDAGNHIIGFTGMATPFGTIGEFNDGGVVFGPGGVLFTAQWPENKLGQTAPGALDESRVDDLGPLGIGGSSIAALNFVPGGFPGAGQMKVVSWVDGNWYTVDFAPDGAGTFNLLSATLETQIPGGPAGFVYIDPGNPGFGVHSVLVSDWSLNRVSAYEIDGNGDPIVATRRDFLLDLEGADGAFIDPQTGDFLFSTLSFDGVDTVIAVRGFQPPSVVPEPGTLVLIAMGAALMVARGRRRKRL